MIENLLSAGVDGVLIETQNNLHEALAAAKAAAELAAPPRFWMISFCTRSDGPPNILLSGETLTDALPSLEGAFSIGVNCVAAPAIESQIKLLRLLVAADVRISTYANVGKATSSGEWQCTDAIDPETYAKYAMRWVAARATVIGGCCGTRPDTIRAMGRALGR
jgi:homocysteine S-methyltransferase